MKKCLILLLVTTFAISMLFMVIGCKQETSPAEEIVQEVEEEVTPPDEKIVEEEEVITSPKADIIFINGQIVTMEPDMPQAEALAILGEDILAVGGNDNIMELLGPETEVIDLDGRALLPGFVDTHVHLQKYVSEGHTYEEAQEFVLKDGTTTIGIMTVPQDMLEQLQDLERQDGLQVRTTVYLTYANACGDLLGDWYKEYPPDRDPTLMLRVVGVKFYADGGACMRPAFSINLPEWWVIEDPKGDLYFTEEEIGEILIEVQEAGYQAAIHAVGDRAVETVINGIEIALDGRPNTYRHRMEHNSTIRPELLTRYGELGIVPTVIGYNKACDPDNPFAASFEEMIQTYPDTYPLWIRPVRQLIDANPGLPIAWHSDRPWFPINPILDLYRLTTGNDIKQDGVTICEAPDWLANKAINIEEALNMMTIGGAYALFMEDYIGSLKPGKYADLVVLSENPITIDPDSILDIEVLLTMVGGQVKYCAPEYDFLCPNQ